MADEIPIIPKAEQIWIHTGNIVNWNRLKRKLTQSPTEELSECITSTITSWLESVDRTELQYAESVQCLNKKSVETLPEEEREEFKVTVKVFVNNPCAEVVEEAIEKACSELGVSRIETVLISLPEQHHDLESLKPVWTALEERVNAEKIYSIGTADLDKNQLEQLYDWATVKPCIDQVNLESCCVMPVDLMEFAKEKDIQLLTHNDPTEILTTTRLQEQMASTLTSRDAELWEPSCVVRYSVLIKCRGIIKSKGYIVRGSRQLAKRK